jgi:hypothetical protein
MFNSDYLYGVMVRIPDYDPEDRVQLLRPSLVLKNEKLLIYWYSTEYN